MGADRCKLDSAITRILVLAWFMFPALLYLGVAPTSEVFASVKTPLKAPR
jgi:hypothetical protein